MIKTLQILYFLVLTFLAQLYAQPNPGYNGNGDPVGGDPVGGGAPVGSMLIPMLIYAIIFSIFKVSYKLRKGKPD